MMPPMITSEATASRPTGNQPGPAAPENKPAIAPITVISPNVRSPATCGAVRLPLEPDK